MNLPFLVFMMDFYHSNTKSYIDPKSDKLPSMRGVSGKGIKERFTKQQQLSRVSLMETALTK